MLTTAGLSRSAMSTNDTPACDADTVAGARAGARGGAVAGIVVADMAGAGVIVPATTRPIRNATVAARETVTARNRRVID